MLQTLATNKKKNLKVDMKYIYTCKLIRAESFVRFFGYLIWVAALDF